MAYNGSCHCGAVTFSVAGEIPSEVISCNCSHCRRKALLLTFVPAASFTLERGEASLATYLFNTHRIAHRFCTTCGCQPFAEGRDKDGAETRAVNLRCVPAADLAALKLQNFDGASH